MENNNGPVNKGIKSSMSLIAFARTHGKMSVAPFVNKDGDHFKSCVFTDPNNPDSTSNKTFVAFSSNLGELTPTEIASQKSDLQVVTLESGTHILCRMGENNWEEVDLGL